MFKFKIGKGTLIIKLFPPSIKYLFNNQNQ